MVNAKMTAIQRDMNKAHEDFLSVLNSRSQDIFKRLVERVGVVPPP